MNRREFTAGLIGVASCPSGAVSQQASRVPRIAVIVSGEEADQDLQARVSGLKQGLERLGWVEGRNVQLNVRFAEGRPDRFQPLAKELIALRPNLIVAQTPPVVAAVRREDREIAMVFVDVSDPIGPGFIESVARPGGNTTGMLSFEPGVIGKWLAMLKEIAPDLSRVMMLGNSRTTAFDYFQRAAESAAPAFGIEIVPYQVTTAVALDSTIDAFASAGNTGLMILPDTTILVHREVVIASAAKNHVPAVYAFSHFVRAGGLMSYSHEPVHQFRVAASSIDRILRGAKPGDIPAQAATKFQMVLNLKTAKALGLAVPPGILVAADEVIE